MVAEDENVSREMAQVVAKLQDAIGVAHAGLFQYRKGRAPRMRLRFRAWPA